MDSSNISFAVGAMGAMLMPYNLYLQSALVLSRQACQSRRLCVPEADVIWLVV